MSMAQVLSLDKNRLDISFPHPPKAVPSFLGIWPCFSASLNFVFSMNEKSVKFTLVLLGMLHRAWSRHKAGCNIDAWPERSEQCFYPCSWYRAGGGQRQSKKPQLSYWEELRWSSGGWGKLGHSKFRHWPYLGPAAMGKWEKDTAHCISCWTSQHYEKSAFGIFFVSFPSSHLVIYFLAALWELLLTLYLA